MKRFLLLLLVAGCDGPGLGARPSPSLLIELGSSPVREASLLVGQSIRLEASVRGSARPVGPGGIDWSTDRPEVASVEPAGVVTGRGEGTARVVAVAGLLTDTILVTVFPTVPGGGVCEDAAAGMTLAPGEAFTTAGAAAAELCLAGGAEYVLVPFHAADAGESLHVEMRSEGIAPPVVEGTALPRTDSPSQATPTGEADFERRLREREARELRPLVVRHGAPREPDFSLAPATLPVIGETMTLNVNSVETCSAAVRREARIVAVTEHAIILHDLANPVGGFTDDEYRAFGLEFDRLVFPTVRDNFGEPTDIDGNARVLVLFTRAVNEITQPGSTSYVGGFFFARDLFPRRDSGGLRGCGASNVGELLYMLVPDPKGEVNGNSRSKRFVTERTIAILAHELQHLIGTGRRLRALGLEEWNEEFWLSEGLSHIAEELTFYAAASLAPRAGLHYTQMKAGPAVNEAFEQVQMTNLTRLSSYALSPGKASPFFGSELATRGASWGFLRYLADRMGGSEAALWRSIIDGESIGYHNLMTAIGASPLSWVHDWVTALYVDNLVQVPPRFRNPSWNYRSVLPWVDLNAGVYPLAVRILRTRFGSRETSFELAPGGAGFVRISVPSGSRAAVRTSSGGTVPPTLLRMTLVRTR